MALIPLVIIIQEVDRSLVAYNIADLQAHQVAKTAHCVILEICYYAPSNIERGQCPWRTTLKLAKTLNWLEQVLGPDEGKDWVKDETVRGGKDTET